VSVTPPANGNIAYLVWIQLKRAGDVNFIAVSPDVYATANNPGQFGAQLSDIAYFSAGNGYILK
jgi:hypothetical protein